MEPIELAPKSVEAIALRVAQLLATNGQRDRAVDETVPLLPISAPRSAERNSRGRRRDDLAKGLQGTPFRRTG